jgi:hypothetical protein
VPVSWIWMGTRYGGNDAMLALSSLLYLEAVGLMLWSELQPDWPKRVEVTENLPAGDLAAA